MRVFCVLRARRRPHATLESSAQLRLPGLFRRADRSADPDAVPLARMVLWALFGVAVLLGLVLYFKYERLVAPLLT